MSSPKNIWHPSRLAYGICFLLSLLLTTHNSACAQLVPDNYSRQRSQTYNRFYDSIQSEFLFYMEHLWNEYQLFEGEHSPRNNKPEEQPRMDSTLQTEDTLTVESQIPYSIIDIVNRADAVEVPFSDAAGTDTERKYIVPFYGRQLSIPIPEKVSDLTLAGTSKRQVARFWKKLIANHAAKCVASLDRQRRNLYRGDWGLLDLIRHFSATVYPNHPDGQAVLSIFLLNAMHYDARVGRIDNHLVMLVNTGNRLYDIPYIKVDTTRYYAFGVMPRKGRLHTYTLQMPEASRPVDMHLDYSPRLGGALSAQPYRYSYSDHRMQIPINQPLMDFYAR